MWELDHKVGYVLKNWCFQTVALEKTLESPLDCKENTRQSWRKSTLNIYWKDWCWSSNTLATWCKEPIHWTRPWCGEGLKAGGERDYRGWDDLMLSMTQWTWVWANSKRWQRTGKHGVLQSMGLQRVRHDLVTEQQLCIGRRGGVLLGSLFYNPVGVVLAPTTVWDWTEHWTKETYLRRLRASPHSLNFNNTKEEMQMCLKVWASE